MNISQMKNMIVLRDLPSNIVDEAIVILKNNAKVKNRQAIENGNGDKFKENSSIDYDSVIKEAEYVIENYIKDIEKPKGTNNQLKDMKIKYKKLQISSLFIGITLTAAMIIRAII